MTLQSEDNVISGSADAESVGFLLVSTATVVMLEATRVLLTYSMFGIDQWQSPLLSALPLLAILGPVAGAVSLRYLGPRSTVLLASSLIVMAQVILQVSVVSGVRIPSAAAVTMAWGWLVFVLFVSRGSLVINGFVLGLALDLTIRIALETVDPPWMPSPLDYGVILGLVASLLAGAILWSPSRGPGCGGPREAGALFTVGPLLVLYHLVIGSLGLLQVNADLALPAAATILALGMVLGVASVTSFLLAKRSEWITLLKGRATVVAVAMGGGVALWLAWRPGMLSALGVLGATPASLLLLAHALSRRPGDRDNSGLLTNAFWFAAGMAFQSLLLVLYFFESRPAIAVAVAFFALALFAVLHTPSGPRILSFEMSSAIPAVVASGLLLITSAFHWVTWSATDAGNPLSGSFRVMTYNIRSGFSDDNRFNLEAVAAAIERADPDVVVLQEVSRGWPFTTGIDQAQWLSEGLDMPFIFGHSSANILWGIAILSKAPMIEIARFDLQAPGFDNGAVLARVQGEPTDLWVIGTHFAAPGKAEAARVQEAEQLIDIWDGREPALVIGDFNAPPHAPPLDVLTRAGLTDVGQEAGVVGPTFAGDRRIDHIFATPGIEVVDVHILESDASDHRPVVADLRLP